MSEETAETKEARERPLRRRQAAALLLCALPQSELSAAQSATKGDDAVSPTTKCPACYGFDDQCGTCGGTGEIPYKSAVDRVKITALDVLIGIVLLATFAGFVYELWKTFKSL